MANRAKKKNETQVEVLLRYELNQYMLIGYANSGEAHTTAPIQNPWSGFLMRLWKTGN